ncbi:MAG: hypothetical protein PHC47_02420 [Clostridia bacterium]|nr:hypothetical protein [Clostridia bacterium]
MITIILPLTSKKIILKDLTDELKKTFGSFFNLLILCERRNSIIDEFETLKPNATKQQKKIDKKKIIDNGENPIEHFDFNISLFIFPNGTKEESMINASIKEFDESDFILIRNDIQNIDSNLLTRILEERQQSQCDIIMFKNKEKKNIFSKFINKTIKATYSFFFDIHFYDGDIGVQYFSAFAHSIMKNINNPMLLTKSNRWVEMNIKYIDFEVPRTKLTEKSYGKNKPKFVIYTLIFTILLATSIILGGIYKLPLIFWFAVFFFLLFFLSLAKISALRIYLANKIGDIRAGKVYIIEKKVLSLNKNTENK